ncbi:hypothetical protein [Nonomuraea sp. KM90]|uniref:hypothetical protein n=1 Tax=Nonomuraea sp. KM90 TaxID=3457428 RepID=UPI003FCE7A3B
MTTTTTLASPLRTTVDPSFELRLVEAIRPITEHFLAVGIHHLFDTGIYDALADRPPVPIPALADELTMDVDRLRGFLLYLANEDIVQLADDRVALTGRARGLDEFRAWYTFLIGGYATTIQQIGGALARGAPDLHPQRRVRGRGQLRDQPLRRHADDPRPAGAGRRDRSGAARPRLRQRAVPHGVRQGRPRPAGGRGGAGPGRLPGGGRPG